jgi:hypothetical protein
VSSIAPPGLASDVSTDHDPSSRSIRMIDLPPGRRRPGWKAEFLRSLRDLQAALRYAADTVAHEEIVFLDRGRSA